MRNSVFQDWLAGLPMQQQSVLVLANRGPDGIEKHHPCKIIVRNYRASVIKAAKYGRALHPGQYADTFMSLGEIDDHRLWLNACKAYYEVVDCLPHHYHMHLLHGAEILGYKHPDPVIRGRWQMFYYDGCDDAHMLPESEAAMDKRLNDWGQEFWGT